MSDPGPRIPADRHHRERVEPVPMSTAEKLMCEWEARHDVAARKGIADVAPVQHYLSHCRCDDDLHRPEPSRPRARRGPAAGPGIPPGVSQWFRWGEEGRPDAPVIPPC